MSAILSVLTSGAFGSALGSLFQWLNRKTEIAAKKMEYDHDERMADLQNQQALQRLNYNCQPPEARRPLIAVVSSKKRWSMASSSSG